MSIKNNMEIENGMWDVKQLVPIQNHTYKDYKNVKYF